MSAHGKAPPVRGRHLTALRTCALYPDGLRRDAYPSAMPLLVARGLVEERSVRWKSREAGETGWFLTDAGREMLTRVEPKNAKSPTRQ